MCRSDPLSDYNNPPQADFLQHDSEQVVVGNVVLWFDASASFRELLRRPKKKTQAARDFKIQQNTLKDVFFLSFVTQKL